MKLSIVRGPSTGVNLSPDRLHELYSMMLQMSVAVRAEGQGEEYSVSVPTGTIKEDL